MRKVWFDEKQVDDADSGIDPLHLPGHLLLAMIYTGLPAELSSLGVDVCDLFADCV